MGGRTVDLNPWRGLVVGQCRIRSRSREPGAAARPKFIDVGLQRLAGAGSSAASAQAARCRRNAPGANGGQRPAAGRPGAAAPPWSRILAARAQLADAGRQHWAMPGSAARSRSWCPVGRRTSGWLSPPLLLTFREGPKDRAFRPAPGRAPGFLGASPLGDRANSESGRCRPRSGSRPDVAFHALCRQNEPNNNTPIKYHILISYRIRKYDMI